MIRMVMAAAVVGLVSVPLPAFAQEKKGSTAPEGRERPRPQGGTEAPAQAPAVVRDAVVAVNIGDGGIRWSKPAIGNDLEALLRSGWRVVATVPYRNQGPAGECFVLVLRQGTIEAPTEAEVP